MMLVITPSGLFALGEEGLSIKNSVQSMMKRVSGYFENEIGI